MLEAKQAARDQGILDGLAHPARSYGYTERAPMLVGKLTHTIEVAPGSERVKVISNGGSLPFVGVTSYDITVKDAAGKEVGNTEASAASGTTALDLDLRKLDSDKAKAEKRFADLTFGKWTVEIGAVGTVSPPIDLGPADDAAEKRFVTSLISVFGAQPKPCTTTTQFAPVATKDYRFQDDKVAAVAAFPPDPEFSYVGPLPDGSLGNRTPERRLAATFGQATTSGKEPQFATAPLTEPVTIGGAAELRAFIQGPSEAVAGLLSGDLVDIDPQGGPAIIGRSPKNVAAKATVAMPTETRVPIPIATVHRAGRSPDRRAAPAQLRRDVGPHALLRLRQVPVGGHVPDRAGHHPRGLPARDRHGPGAGQRRRQRQEPVGRPARPAAGHRPADDGARPAGAPAEAPGRAGRAGCRPGATRSSGAGPGRPERP